MANTPYYTKAELQAILKNNSLCYYEFDLDGNAGNPLFKVYTAYEGSSEYFIGFKIGQELDLSDSVYKDLYRLLDAEVYKMENGVMVNQNITLLLDSENEATYRVTGASDFTGGYHGDETKTDVKFFASGVEITNLTQDISLTFCSDFYYYQKSNLHTTDNAAHPIEALHYKITSISDSGYNTKNTIEWQAVRSVSTWYPGISCIHRNSSSFIHNDFLDSDTFTAANGSTKISRVGAREYHGSNSTTGLGVFATSKINLPIGKDSLADMFVQDRSFGDNKYYRKSSGNTSVGDVWQSEFRLKFKR